MNKKALKKKSIKLTYLSFAIIFSFFIIFSNRELRTTIKQNANNHTSYVNNIQEPKEIIGNEEIIRKDLFPDLYVRGERPVEVYEQKVCYLTFDDGPSNRTLEILDILDKYQIKATFFVTGHSSGPKSQDILRQIFNRGHQIGIHTWSHNYKTIYQSVEAFLDDFNKIYTYVFDSTGFRPEIFRFPGGSVNSFNRNIYKDIINEMTSRGFKYYDWNMVSNDAIGKLSKYQIFKNSTVGIDKLDRAILLCHDNEDKKTTVQALEDIINAYKNAGYRFDSLRKDIKPVVMNFR